MPYIMKQVNIELDQIQIIDKLPVPFSVFCRNALYDFDRGLYDPKDQQQNNYYLSLLRYSAQLDLLHNYHIEEPQCDLCKHVKEEIERVRQGRLNALLD